MNGNRSGAWAGWVVFAGTMLLILSAINILEGFVALFQDERVVATPNNFVVVDLTSWGWTLVLFGVVMLATGIGLLMAQTWARITAIVVVGLHAAAQVASIGAYPIWSLLMIALDTVILFALTARWSAAREDLVYGREAGIGAAMSEEEAMSGHRMAQERSERPRPVS
jgi:cytochrome b subunit of formate dehydrogenase